MANWDPKYIVTELKASVGDAPWTPVFTEKESNRVLSLDSKVLKGAFYTETRMVLAREVAGEQRR